MPAIAAPAEAEPERFAPKFAIGPSISVVIGSKSEFFYGADAKIGLSDDFAFRPFVAFSNESASIYGGALTYNLPISSSREQKVRGRSYRDALSGNVITERDTTVGGGEIAPFIGAGGVVANRNLNSSFQPYAVVGIDAPIGLLQAQYLFNESVVLLKGGLAFRF
jgi:hypothetical protein